MIADCLWYWSICIATLQIVKDNPSSLVLKNRVSSVCQASTKSSLHDVAASVRQKWLWFLLLQLCSLAVTRVWASETLWVPLTLLGCSLRWTAGMASVCFTGGAHPVAECKMLLVKQKQNSCSNCFIIDSSTDCPESSHRSYWPKTAPALTKLSEPIASLCALLLKVSHARVGYGELLV